MTNKTLIFVVLAVVVIAGIIFCLFYYAKCCGDPRLSNDLIIVKQSGGQGELIAECGDKNYIANTADYIVEGVVEKSEAQWDEQKEIIHTYVDFSIQNYLKGDSFGNKLQLQVGGGCVGDICLEQEETFSFKQGDNLRLYLEKAGTKFSIVCGQLGVEKI